MRYTCFTVGLSIHTPQPWSLIQSKTQTQIELLNVSYGKPFPFLDAH